MLAPCYREQVQHKYECSEFNECGVHTGIGCQIIPAVGAQELQ